MGQTRTSAAETTRGGVARVRTLLVHLALVLTWAAVVGHAESAMASRGTRGGHTPVPLASDVPDARVEHDRIYRELRTRRALNLARFEAYVARRIYPRNTYRPGRLNVLVDAGGRICAAATVMTVDGHGDLVRKLAREDNFLRLADVHDGPLLDWMLESGFTQEELAMIQEPFEALPDGSARSLDGETRRLERRYGEIVRALGVSEARGLELATQRVMAARARVRVTHDEARRSAHARRRRARD